MKRALTFTNTLIISIIPFLQESMDEKIASVVKGKISGFKDGVTTLTASATTGLDTSSEIKVTVSCNK
jgi:hypothetical protein